MNWGDIPGEVTKVDFQGIAYEEYVSPASGVKEVRWLGTPKLYKQLPLMGDKPGVVLRRPKAYWVPVTKPEVIERRARFVRYVKWAVAGAAVVGLAAAAHTGS